MQYYKLVPSLRFRRDAANNTSAFDKEDVGWTNINTEVDMVTVMVLAHLQKLGIEHLQLPDMKESISVVFSLKKKLITLLNVLLSLPEAFLHYLRGWSASNQWNCLQSCRHSKIQRCLYDI